MGLKFVHVMLGYHLKNDKQLGPDLTIQQSDRQRCVNISRSDQIERLTLTGEILKVSGGYWPRHNVLAGILRWR